MREVFPRPEDSRTAAALGVNGRNFATWQILGVREVADGELAQVWQGPATFPTLPTVGAALKAISDAAVDTALGVGARRVSVIYLNSALEIRQAAGPLDGLATVPLFKVDQVTGLQTAVAVTDALRVVALDVTAVGASGNNDGIVDVTIGGVVQARIPRTASIVSNLQKNSARPGAFTVPAGFCAVLDGFTLDPGACLALQARDTRGAWRGVVGQTQKSFNLVPGTYQELRSPIIFATKTDLRIVVDNGIAAPGVTPANTWVAPRVDLYLYPSADSADTDPTQIPQLGRCGFALV